MSCEHTTFFLVLVSGKRLRSQAKEVAVNVYEHFEELGRRKRTEGSLKQTCDAPGLSRSSINLTVLMTNDFRHFQFSLFVKRFFSKQCWLYSCPKLQKTIPGYHFNSIIDTKAFIFIIRIVILTCHVIVGWLLSDSWLTFRGENQFLLSARRCAI